MNFKSTITKTLLSLSLAVSFALPAVLVSGSNQITSQSQEVTSPIEFAGLGHVNIVVDDVNEGVEFYSKLFGAQPIQLFPNFQNTGFAKSAGFLDKPEDVSVSIAFLTIPNVNLILELMEYHTPKTESKIRKGIPVSDIAGVRHIALKVKNVQKAYKHVTKLDGVYPINPSKDYRPYKIDEMSPDGVILFEEFEDIDSKKAEIADIIGKIYYCYFVDKYGVQWELEQGHSDIGEGLSYTFKGIIYR